MLSLMITCPQNSDFSAQVLSAHNRARAFDLPARPPLGPTRNGRRPHGTYLLIILLLLQMFLSIEQATAAQQDGGVPQRVAWWTSDTPDKEASEKRQFVSADECHLGCYCMVFVLLINDSQSLTLDSKSYLTLVFNSPFDVSQIPQLRPPIA